MEDLNNIVNKQRAKFREKFKQAVSEVQNQAEKIKPQSISADIFTEFPPDSNGRKWQNEFLEILENKISKEIYLQFQEILKERKDYKCLGCATCCNLACSEYSPQELQKRAGWGALYDSPLSPEVGFIIIFLSGYRQSGHITLLGFFVSNSRPHLTHLFTYILKAS